MLRPTIGTICTVGVLVAAFVIGREMRQSRERLEQQLVESRQRNEERTIKQREYEEAIRPEKVCERFGQAFRDSVATGELNGIRTANTWYSAKKRILLTKQIEGTVEAAEFAEKHRGLELSGEPGRIATEADYARLPEDARKQFADRLWVIPLRGTKDGKPIAVDLLIDVREGYDRALSGHGVEYAKNVGRLVGILPRE